MRLIALIKKRFVSKTQDPTEKEIARKKLIKIAKRREVTLKLLEDYAPSFEPEVLLKFTVELYKLDEKGLFLFKKNVISMEEVEQYGKDVVAVYVEVESISRYGRYQRLLGENSLTLEKLDALQSDNQSVVDFQAALLTGDPFASPDDAYYLCLDEIGTADEKGVDDQVYGAG